MIPSSHSASANPHWLFPLYVLPNAVIKLIVKKYGLPEKLNVHSLRHSNASLLIANGADVAAVAGLLGHTQPSTTPDVCTHTFGKNKKTASETFQQRLEI